MSNICTSIEQSKKLIELGLDINTADMCLTWVGNVWNQVVGNADEIRKIQIINVEDRGEDISIVNVIPAWSLSALLNLIPNGSLLTKTNFGNYTFQGVVDKTPIDAAFNYICYLFEKGILKTNNK